MKAILIDAVNRKVEEIKIKNDLYAFYDKIGCETIQVVPLGGKHLLIVDEEGRLREWQVGFRLAGGNGIAGNALIVCHNGRGNFTNALIPAGLVEMMVSFLDLTQTPLPPPAFGFAPTEEFTPAGIAKARDEAVKNKNAEL